MQPALILVGLVAAGVVLLAPILAIAALLRVRALEQRIARFEAARAAAPEAALPSVPRAAVVEAVRPSAGAGGFDWETAIAGRWLNRLGLLAVVVGVSYLLKLAIDNDWIGPVGQIALGIALGAALLVASLWFLKRGYAYFADGVTGLGAAVLYLSLWAGGSYYHLFSPAVAFVAMAMVTAAMLVIALGRNSQPVAVLALAGGFLTPALVSTGQDAQVMLFSYLAILNAAILPVAGARDWRFLESPAFVLTHIYFWGWFGRFYSPAAMMPTAAFAALFFAEFAAVPLVQSRRTGVMFAEQVLLTFANASICLLALRQVMWDQHRWVLTAATLLLAAVHVLLAQLVPRRQDGVAQARLVFAGVALMLLTVAIPIRLDGPWITVAWAVEGAVLMWSGFEYRLARLRGVAFLLFALVFWRLIVFPGTAQRFLLNARFVTELVVIAACTLSVWAARRHRDRQLAHERLPFNLLGLAVNVLTVWALTLEVHLHFRSDPFAGVPTDIDSRLAEGLVISLLWVAYAAALTFAGVRRAIAGLRWQGLALLGLTSAKVFLYDLAALRGIYRVGSSIALGVVLLIVSFIYQRRVASAKRVQEAS